MRTSGAGILLAGGLALSFGSAPPSAPALTLSIQMDRQLIHQLVVRNQTGATLPFHVSASGDHLFSLTLDCVPGEYVLEVDRLLSAPIAVNDRICPRPIPVEWFGRATIVGTATASRGERPRVLAVDVKTCRTADRPALSLGTYPAVVRADGRWESGVPADCIDAAVLADGFRAVPLKRIGVTIGQRLSVGALVLRPQRLIDVVVNRPDGTPVPHAQVIASADLRSPMLKRFLQGSPVANDLPVVMTRANGKARLQDIDEPYLYVLARTDEGLGVAGPIDTHGRSARSVQIVLRPKVSVEVALPTEHARWPTERLPLRVVATPWLASQWVSPASIEVSLALHTSVQVALPAAGMWRFEIRAEGSGSLEPLAKKNVDLTDGRSRTIDVDFDGDVHHGVVTSDSGRLDGTLAFALNGKEGGSPFAARVSKGSFVTVFPVPGVYNAVFTSDDESIVASQTLITVPKGNSELTVVLSRFRITGAVRLSNGGPAEGAVATLTMLSEPEPASERIVEARVRTDARGRFAFIAVTPGTYELVVTRQGLRSTPRQIRVGPSERESPDVPVTLEGVAQLFRGRVLDSGTGFPLPGMYGMAVLQANGNTQQPQVIEFMSDMQGFFRVPIERLPDDWVNVVVAAPGFPVSLWRIRSREILRQPVKLPSESAGARCVVVLPTVVADDDQGLLRMAGRYRLTNATGASVSIGQLLRLEAAEAFPSPESTIVTTRSLAYGTWRLEEIVPDHEHSGQSMSRTLRTFTLRRGSAAWLRIDGIHVGRSATFTEAKSVH